MKKLLIGSAALLVSLTSFSCSSSLLNSPNSKDISLDVLKEEEPNYTIQEFASFMINKKEHYPISDEFIERYQQNSGGYIDFAEECGIEVDKTMHSPNQKWHFFYSWLLESIKAGTLNWSDSAKSRVYTGLLCPELLLWIYEASGVEPNKVRNAKEAAEKGKAEGTATTTIAKNMRNCVLWTDFNLNKDYKMATEVNLSTTDLSIALGEEDGTIKGTISPTDYNDTPTWSIVEGSDNISIIPNGDEVKVHALREGKAKIRITLNEFISAECDVTVTESLSARIIGVANTLDLSVGSTSTLNPSLSKGTGTFTYSIDNSSVASINSSGVINALSNGSAIVKIACVESPELTREIKIEVFNHGSESTPLDVKDALTSITNVCLNNGDYMNENIYVKGIAENNAGITGDFTIIDSTDNTKKIKVNSSVNKAGVESVAQHDTVTLSGKVSLNSDVLAFNKIGEKDVEIIKNERGNSVISLNEHANATIKIDGVAFEGTKNLQNGSTFEFSVEVGEDYKIDKVKVNDKVISENEGKYSFIVEGDASIDVITKSAAVLTGSLATYNIVYDLGTRQTSKAIADTSELFNTFSKVSENSIITSVSNMNLMYGGGYGGSGENKWVSNNMLKFGSTSVNGDFTLELSHAVNEVKITGYVSSKSSKIRLGDSTSSDWTEETPDNATTLITCSDMNEATKDVVDGNQTSTITVDFKETTSLKIASTNKKPLYITAIEFIYNND